MENASISVDRDQFTCAICLDLLKDPVTISCGHSYCMVCIKGCWDEEDENGIYRCPQCRETFTSRPALGRNPILAEMVGKLKTAEMPAIPAPDHCYPEPGDVECGICVGRKRKAEKSFLVCLDSYCQSHFEHHENLHSAKKHKVVEATGAIKDKVCPEHGKLLEVFCRTDKKCICVSCVTDEHKSHDIVSAETGRAEIRRLLEERFTKQTQERQSELCTLQRIMEPLKISAQEAVADTDMVFTELIQTIEEKRCEATEVIRAQERAELSRAAGLVIKMEQEIVDLGKRDAKLKQLSNTEDHIQSLQISSLLRLNDGANKGGEE
ncbi:E3 ubiquitin-protein ligase TRIM47-like [Chanos chanos]|uniref:E3 ubiquitin-protein ligase TRIM47-like n=1 Tax=Chanos chanos TaxID=29144 RepID=A0A6J2V896_CHACN|nr:E3 ubiquitin-protein ligase TRIM47-like [Chanos chanos]